MRKIISMMMMVATMALFIGCGGGDDKDSSRGNNDLIYETCYLCNGTGVRDCVTCENTGVCTNCNGDGYCDICGGDGLIGEPGSNPDGTINLVMECNHGYGRLELFLCLPCHGCVQ